jgi:uncharacterized protein (TIGR02646 family)
MRRLVRPALPTRPLAYLARKQAEVDAGKDPRATWKAARQTKTMRAIAQVLGHMSGPRRRCMFCEDSRGGDIDHFRPIARYKERTFVWANLLCTCAECNRLKGDRFELDAKNHSLLIDPTAEDPWDFLFYDSHTGIITGRYEKATGRQHPRGKHTTDPGVLPLNVEAVTEGRQRTQRNLGRSVRFCLDQLSRGFDPAVCSAELRGAIRDNDHYGLVAWFFLREGRDELPFQQLRSGHPALWQAFVSSLEP